MRRHLTFIRPGSVNWNVEPQFADPSKEYVPAQLLFLGTIFVVLAVVSDFAYALLDGTLAARLAQRRHLGETMEYLSGAVYCGLGLAAALTSPHK